MLAPSVAASERRGPDRAALVVAAVAVAAVTAAWVARTVLAYRHGMETVDTLWYHLPQAARFVQQGDITQLHYVDGEAIVVFYAANAELLHAYGIALFHNDVLSPVINLGWGALALLAGWACGRPSRTEPYALLGVAMTLGIPALIGNEPGGGYNDVVCLALLLAAAAILINGGLRPAPVAFAAAAAGLALGTKFTMIAPVLVLAAGAVLAARGDRLRHAGIWAAGLIVLGGFWYVRNLVAVGNPLPNLDHLGPISLPSPKVDTGLDTMAVDIAHWRVWRLYFLPGLQHAFGPAAVPLLLLATGGALLALWRRGAVLRVLGAAALLSGLAFVFTPQPLGLPGAPFYFQYNVGRFGAVALALALVLAAVQLTGSRSRIAFLAVGGTIFLATQLAPSIWATGLPLEALAPPVRGAVAATGAAVGLLTLVVALALLRRPAPVPGRRTGLAVAGGAFVALAVAGGFVGNSYAHDRYRATGPLPRIFDRARDIHDARIGITGFVLQYPLYGVDASNHVQFIGRKTAHGGFTRIQNCPAFRRAVDRGRYDWLVLAPKDLPLNPNQTRSPQVPWVRSSPAAHFVMREQAGADVAELYRITGPLDPARCPS